MSNEMISVPRELLALYLSGDGGDWVEAGHELRALLAKPAAQHQGELVLAIELTENKTYGGMHIVKWYNLGGLKEGAHKLYAEQPAPVAVVLPTKEDFKTWADRRTYDLSHSEKGIFHNIDAREAWSCFKAGADAAARLNPPQQ